ncbi:Glucan endo-1,3-beta-glucosidase 7 [Vitis vinifera]|uniref:glucan endo-1,3-beta-D-glucosidase n=1 Tax=Vitis vinifera TaxID=29760 RepID=A0A438KQL0_VITVI|nr:Glucan endo-1,3-beta-glucosidase 7 [Vitis vinifera]
MIPKDEPRFTEEIVTIPSKGLRVRHCWVSGFTDVHTSQSNLAFRPNSQKIVLSHRENVFSTTVILHDMLKMGSLFHIIIFFLTFLVLTGYSSESVELLTLYDSSPVVLQAMSHTGVPIAVSVSEDDLNEVSGSVLMAESWIRTHVLAHYPSTNITTIVVGNTVLCNKDKEDKLRLVLPSLRNVYYSLTRWGLEKYIKVSAAFSSNCLNPDSVLDRDDLADKVIKPLLSFLELTNSTYSVNPPTNFSPLSDESAGLVSSHSESMKKLGTSKLRVNVIVQSAKEGKPQSRKLSFMHSNQKPSSPLPPLEGTASPPPMTFPFAPEMPPIVIPASSPYSFSLPPCSPFEAGAPAPETGVKQGLWCVAKPSVPADTLQEAMDYACGGGGADCEEIEPHGNCYYPDTVLAHASYAFNSYWQKHKKNGGTCSFGGTAMLINADPIEVS